MASLTDEHLQNLGFIWRMGRIYHRSCQLSQSLITFAELTLVSPWRLTVLSGALLVLAARDNRSRQQIMQVLAPVLILLLGVIFVVSLRMAIALRKRQYSPIRAAKDKRFSVELTRKEVNAFVDAYHREFGVRKFHRIFMSNSTKSLMIFRWKRRPCLLLPQGMQVLPMKNPERFFYLLAHEAAHIHQKDSTWMELAIRSDRLTDIERKRLQGLIKLVSLTLCWMQPCLILWAFRSEHVVERMRWSTLRMENIYRAEHLADLYATHHCLRVTGQYSPQMINPLLTPEFISEFSRDSDQPAVELVFDKISDQQDDYHPHDFERMMFVERCVALATGNYPVNQFMESYPEYFGPPERPWWHWLVLTLTFPLLSLLPVGIIMALVSIFGGMSFEETGAYLLMAVVGTVPFFVMARDVAGWYVVTRMRSRFARMRVNASPQT